MSWIAAVLLSVVTIAGVATSALAMASWSDDADWEERFPVGPARGGM